MEPVVVAEDVRKRYGDTDALNGVDLTVEPGDVFGLIGPNGAGKTTLVRTLTGTVEPTGGTVRLLGADPRAVDPHRIAVLPQSFSPPERLTASELVGYYAGLYVEARDPGSVLEAVGLTDAANVRYEHLSGGQQRRVCVASALVNDPEVLFLDEPTTGIDPAGRRTVWGLIESLAADGTAVVLTTHDMAEAERLADRVGLLADGTLVATGQPSALVAEYGGLPRLEVALDPDSTVTDRHLERLDRLDHASEVTDGELVVRDVDPRAIGDVATALDDAGVAYTGLSWTEPGLEDVYLELAGAVEGTTARESVDREPGAGAVTADGAAGPERPPAGGDR